MSTTSELQGPGYSVAILGRNGIRYREGARSVFVDGEMLVGDYDFVIYASSIRQWESSEQVISDSEKQKILRNIQFVCGQNGIRIDVEQ